LLHDQLEQHRRDGEIVRRPLRRAKLFTKTLKRCRVFIVAANVAQRTTQFVEGSGIDPAVFFDAVTRPLAEPIEIPTLPGHADDRHVEVSAFCHRLQGGKNLLVSKIPGSTEKDQGIRMGNAHRFLLI
jgi:hypothetical protein